MTSEYEHLEVLKQQLITLRQEAGATPERIAEMPELMEALGATDPEDAVEKLRQAIEQLRIDDAALSIRPDTFERAKKITLNSYGFGESSASGLDARREEMAQIINRGVGTVKGGEDHALTLLLGRLTRPHAAASERETMPEIVDVAHEPTTLESDTKLARPRRSLIDNKQWRKHMVAGTGIAFVVFLAVAMGAMVVASLDRSENSATESFFGIHPNLLKSHSDFLAMRSAEQIDACSSYLEQKRAEHYRYWAQGVSLYPPYNVKLDPELLPGKPSEEDSPQAILNYRSLVLEAFRREPNSTIASNILSCAYADGIYDSAAAAINVNILTGYVHATNASEMSKFGTFKGVDYRLYPSRVIQYDGCQALFSLINGFNQDSFAWVERAVVCNPQSADWIKDLAPV